MLEQASKNDKKYQAKDSKDLEYCFNSPTLVTIWKTLL